MKTTKEKIYLAEFKQFSKKRLSGYFFEMVLLVSTLLMTCCSNIRLFFNREVDNKLINLVDCRFLARQFGSVITFQIHNRIKRRNSIINI